MSDRAPHTALLPADAPPWLDALAASIVDRLLRDGEALRHVVEMEEELLTLDDVRRRLGFSKNETVVRLVKSGGLPMFKIGGEWRITRAGYRKAALRQFSPPKRSTNKLSIGQR